MSHNNWGCPKKSCGDQKCGGCSNIFCDCERDRDHKHDHCKPRKRSKCPVYLTAALTNPQALALNTPTTIIFNALVTAFPQSWGPCNGGVYNPATGIFTVPRCEGGIYTITAHVTGSDAAGSTLTVDIRVNGTSITQSVIVIPAAGTNVVDLTIIYPLADSQSVTVT